MNSNKFLYYYPKNKAEVKFTSITLAFISSPCYTEQDKKPTAIYDREGSQFLKVKAHFLKKVFRK